MRDHILYGEVRKGRGEQSNPKDRKNALFPELVQNIRFRASPRLRGCPWTGAFYSGNRPYVDPRSRSYWQNYAALFILQPPPPVLALAPADLELARFDSVVVGGVINPSGKCQSA